MSDPSDPSTREEPTELRQWLAICPLEESEERACQDGDPAALRGLHQRLAEVLTKRADPRSDQSWQGGDESALVALPRHQVEAHLWDDLCQTLGNLKFVEARCRAGTVEGLLRDYRRALDAMQRTGDASRSTRHTVGEFARFVGGEAATLSAHPELTLQQAANQPRGSAVGLRARAVWRFRQDRCGWLEWLNAPGGRTSRVLNRDIDFDDGDVCFVSDRDRRVIVGAEQEVAAWDRDTGEPVARHKSWRAAGDPCICSPDRRQLLDTRGDDLSVCCLVTGAPLRRLPREKLLARVAPLETKNRPSELFWRSAAWSYDGARVAAVLSDGRLGIWESTTGELLEAAAFELGWHSGDLAWSPTGDALLVEGPELEVWQASPLRRRCALESHAHLERAWCPDGTRLLTFSTHMDGDPVCKDRLAILDAETGRCLAEISGASDDPRLVDSVYGGLADGSAVLAELDRNHGLAAFSPDGQNVVAETGVEDVGLFDVNTGRRLRHFPSRSLPARGAVWAPTGSRFLVMVNRTRDIEIHDACSSRRVSLVEGLSGVLLCAAWSLAGDELVTVTHSGSSCALSVWELRQEEPDTPAPLENGTVNDLDQLSVGPRGDRVAALSRGSDQVVVFDGDGARLAGSPRTQRVACCAWSPEGTRLAVGAGLHPLSEATPGWGAVAVYRKQEFRELWQGEHDNVVMSVAWSPDGSALVSCSWAPYAEHRVSQVRLWASQQGACLLEAAIDGDVAERVYWSPDSSCLVCEPRWHSALLWDLAEGHVREIPREGAERGRFSDDGRSLLFAKTDGRVRKYSIAQDSDLASWTLPVQGERSSVGWGPDERLIAFYRPDLQVWDLSTEKPLWVLPADREVRCIAFTPCGRKLTIGSKGGQVLIYRAWERPEAEAPEATLVRQFSVATGAFEQAFSLRCPRCGDRRPVSDDVVEELVSSAPAAPTIVTCPACSGSLRLRPYVIDRVSRASDGCGPAG